MGGKDTAWLRWEVLLLAAGLCYAFEKIEYWIFRLRALCARAGIRRWNRVATCPPGARFCWGGGGGRGGGKEQGGGFLPPWETGNFAGERWYWRYVWDSVGGRCMGGFLGGVRYGWMERGFLDRDIYNTLKRKPAVQRPKKKKRKG